HAPVERIAVSVEETTRQVVAHPQHGRFAVEHHFRIGGDALRTLEHLKGDVVARNAHHLRELAAHGGQFVVADPLRPDRHGRLGYVLYLGVYLLKCFRCHGSDGFYRLDSFVSSSSSIRARYSANRSLSHSE